MAGAEHAQPARLHRYQGLSGGTAHSRTVDDYLPDGTLIPNLITEVPTVENGLLAEDLKSVTYKLLDGVKWADGEPLTADDVVFTWKWIDRSGELLRICRSSTESIDSIEAVDPQTVKVSFAEPNANWFEPHAGSTWGVCLP